MGSAITLTAEFARASGLDAGNMRMRTAGRQCWSSGDRDHATTVTNRLLLHVPFQAGGLGGITFTPQMADDLGLTVGDVLAAGGRVAGHNGGPALERAA